MEIDSLPERLESLLTEDFLAKYLVIAKMLKAQTNLFILAKGAGQYIASYMAQKFL